MHDALGRYHLDLETLTPRSFSKMVVQDPTLWANGLTLGYRNKPIVRNVSFESMPGKVLAVIGHNGAGKSTLIKTLMGGLKPLEGKLRWGGNRRIKPAFLGQRTEFDTKFPIKVRDLVAMGGWHQLGLLGRIDKGQQRRIEEALERCGIKDIADFPLQILSAGQLQRALFARTIVQDAPLILLDEPFAGVDQTTEAALLALIDGWASEGRAIILVLHDLSVVLQHCHDALLLGQGRALFGCPQSILTPHNLVAHGYLSSREANWMEMMYSNGETLHG